MTNEPLTTYAAPGGFSMEADRRVEAAASALRDALTDLQLTLEEPEVIRAMTGDVVFRCGNLAAKVYPPDADTSQLALRLSILNEAAGGPWVPPAYSGVVGTDAGSVTLWPWCDTTRPPTWPELGALLRRFRDTDVPGVEALPIWTPLRRVGAQMSRYLSDSDADPKTAHTLLAARLEMLAAVPGITSDLGFGLIHGDVHPGNTAVWQGQLAFIDLDTVGYGPREYDLVGAALRLQSGELSSHDYDAFCRTQDYDVRDWEHLALIEDICELGAVTFALGENGVSAERGPRIAAFIDAWRERLGL